MKNFAKKLALFLALAMVLTTVNASPIQAASKITLKSGAAAPASVYAGHSYTLKVAGTTVKFTSSNKKVATIGSTTGTMKPVAPGTVKITAKSKKTGKTVATKSFKVLQRATAVAAESKELYLSAVGDKATIKATKTPATSTDVVKFFTADKTIATVGMTSGKVTAKAEGKTTISIYAMATKSTAKSSKYNKVGTVDVYVGAYLASAKQTSITDIDVTFKSDVKEVKQADFSIVNDTTKQTISVKSATISKTDAKKVTITTFADVKDGTYTVTYGKSTAQFTATDGKVASIAIEPTVVTVAKETKLYVVTKDANGIQIGKYEKGTDSFPAFIDFSVETNDGYVAGESSIYLNSKTSTAKAKATYHTWKMEDVNGVQTEVGKLETGDVTITATEAEAISNYSYTVAQNKPAWNSTSFKQKTDICVGQDNYKVFFKFTDASNNEIADYSGYEVSSSNEDVLLVTANNSDGSVDVAPIKEGTAYLIIKNATTKTVITTLPITVKAKAKETSIVLDKTSVTVSNVLAAEDVVEIGYKVLDQYGEDMNKTATCTLKSKSTKDENAASVATIKDNKIIVDAGSIAAGSYVFEIGYEKLSTKILSVTVKEPATAGAFSFDVNLSASTMDAVVKTAADTNKSVDIKPVMTKGGIAYQALTVGKNAGDGNTYTSVDVSVAIKNSKGETVASEDASKFAVVTNGKAIDAGTYTVVVTFTATKKADSKEVKVIKSKTITVTNTQPTVTFETAEKTASIAGLVVDTKNKQVTSGVEDLVNACYTFYYDGTKYGKNGTAVKVTAHECSYVTSTYVAFTSITIEIPVAAEANAQIKVNVASSVNLSTAATTTAAPVVSSAAPTTTAPVVSSAAPTTTAPVVSSEAPVVSSAAPVVSSEAPTTVTP